MLVLALDTTSRRGSAALRRDGVLIDCEVGDPALTHGQRLPGDLMRLLDRQNVDLGDVDLFAVAAGPGSFTGLRIGIAAMQGLALASRRPLAGVSALHALNAAAHQEGRDLFSGGAFLTGAWIDAQRGEVFSALYRGDQLLDGPSVDTPGGTLSRWSPHSTDGEGESILFVGDGALAYAELIRRGLPRTTVRADVPPLAPAVAQLAEAQAGSRESLSPGAIRPIYVRRPDAELARDRKAKGAGFGVRGSGCGFGSGTRHPEPGTQNPQGMSWIIERTLAERDLDEIEAIETASFSTPWTRQMYLRELQNPDVSFLYVLRVPGEGRPHRIAGFCSFWLVLDEIHINNLAVRVDHQGQGVGTALLQYVLDAGASRGAGRATLEVRRSNAAALRLYERLGFEVAGTRPNYYLSPPEDALILWRGGLEASQSTA